MIRKMIFLIRNQRLPIFVHALSDRHKAFSSLTGRTVAEETQGGSYVFHPGGKEVIVTSGRINWYGRDPEWKDELGFRGTHDVENQPGDWNRLECIADGDRLTYILNGEMVNAAKHVSPARGRIQI